MRQSVWEGDAFKCGAIIKCIIANTRYAVFDNHRLNELFVVKPRVGRIISKSVHGATSRNDKLARGFVECPCKVAPRAAVDHVLYKGLTALSAYVVFDIVELNRSGDFRVPKKSLAYCIPFIFGATVNHTRKVRAIGERLIADARDTVRNLDARKTCAIVERIPADARDTIRERDAHKVSARLERRRADARDTVTDRDARKATAIPKRIRADARDAIRNRDARKACAIGERIRADARDATIGRNDTGFTTGNQGFACGFNQAIPRGMIFAISILHRDARKA